MAFDESRPQYRVTSTALASDWLVQEMGKQGTPLACFLKRGEEIVYTPALGKDGYTEARGQTSDDESPHNGPATVSILKPASLLSFVQNLYQPYKMEKDGEREKKVRTMFPRSAASVASNAPPHLLPNLRPLKGVTHTPIVRADGSILQEPGYDAATGFLYLPDPDVTYPTVSATPTDAEVSNAVALLDYMVCGFDWKTPGDQVNYYGFLLTPLIRDIAPPSYKLFAITAHQAGSGKTLLAQVARNIHGAVWRPSFPDSEEEFKKWMLAILMGTTAPVVVADNVSGHLGMAALDSMLTEASLSERLLGANNNVQASNDRVWCITGNNVALGADLARRTVRVQIDPNHPEPQNRTGFATGDLKEWSAQHRGELVSALLTLVSNWVAKGRPMPARKQSDGFNRWETVLGGILHAAGFEHEFDSVETRPEATSADPDWGPFLAFLYENQQRTEDGHAIPWKAGEIAPRFGWVAEMSGTLDSVFEGARTIGGQDPPMNVRRGVWSANILPDDKLTQDAMRGGGVSAKSLGRWFMNRQGRWANGFKVVTAGKKDGTQLWVVERLG